MTEEDRNRIISEIQTEIKDKESLSTKYEELKNLTKDSNVVKYLNLLEDICRIERDIYSYKNPIDGSINDSLEERIRFGFRVRSFDCNDDVWLYNGSYYKYTNFKNESDYIRYNSENLGDNFYEFSYNSYICLECGKEVKMSKSDWRKFEDSHLVLKIQDYINIEHYQDLYYQLLYQNYDFIVARQIVVDEFNKSNKNKTKVLSSKTDLK